MFTSASLLILTLLSCICSLAAKEILNCPKPESGRQDINGEEDFQMKGDKFVEFDWDISKELNAVEKGNIVISPISLKVVLAMLYEGARGKTAQEIGDALDLTNSTMTRRSYTRERFSTILKSLQTHKGKYEIKIGTHVFIDSNAVPKVPFQCKLQQYYNSDMEKVDFTNTAAAVKAINNWASNVTEGHIKDLISEAEAHSSTIMLLLNAVYFKGLWQIPFPENQTKEGLFHLNEEESVKIPLMNTTDRFAYYNMKDLNAKLIKIPYLGDKFAMYVLLPNSKTGLSSIAQALGPDRPLVGYRKNMTMTTVNLIMPKFEFDFTTSLRPSLEKLGIKTIFNTEAQLSDIAETVSGSLVVSNVLQKAGISVTEIGTVAYAATVAELMDKFGGDDDIVEFKADRPFLFFIEDETVHTTVFVGKVTNPAKAQVKENKVTPSTSDTKIPSDQPHPASTDPTQCVGTACTPTISELEDKFGSDTDESNARFNFFDADLLKELATKEKGNIVISPASIKALLALVIEGAKESTLSELQTLLRLPQNMTEAHRLLSALQTTIRKNTRSKVTFDSVTQAFISKDLSINTTYAKNIKEHYDAEVSQQDFSSPEIAANNINSWIGSRTRGLIDMLIEPEMITSDTYSILVSAIYFDGKWKNEFLPKDTKDTCFYIEPNMECQIVPMMFKNEELYYKYDRSLDSHVLQIPYEDEKFSMLIVVPREKNGIKQLTQEVSRLSFPDLLDKMNLFEVNLKLPRFTIEYGTELITTLKKLGLQEVFSENAKLPYMINNRKGKVSAVVHKAKIEVSEKGTKAAAASGAAVVPLMFGLDLINLDVDHPFYYFIYERDSQTVLFAGRLSSIDGAPRGQPLKAGGTNHVRESEASKLDIHDAENHQYIPSSTQMKNAIQFPDSLADNSNDKNYNRYNRDQRH